MKKVESSCCERSQSVFLSMELFKRVSGPVANFDGVGIPQSENKEHSNAYTRFPSLFFTRKSNLISVCEFSNAYQSMLCVDGWINGWMYRL